MSISVKIGVSNKSTLKKVAFILLIFMVVGFVLKIVKNNHNETIGRMELEQKSISYEYGYEFELNVDNPSVEKSWQNALNTKLNGITEYSVSHGRIDILTDSYAIEVDFYKKWKEGVGQCLFYANKTGKKPVLALIYTEENLDDMAIKSVCKEHDILLWKLFMKK